MHWLLYILSGVGDVIIMAYVNLHSPKRESWNEQNECSFPFILFSCTKTLRLRTYDVRMGHGQTIKRSLEQFSAFFKINIHSNR